jgi:23S rRNA (cytidine1920-2'-O)/16S rRNA (cytidine1409-2'-O)-methyltransferase
VDKGTKKRLDLLCVDRGVTESRQRAQALIMAGQVLVDGKPVTKAGTAVPADARIELLLPDHPYVSRGGLKLEAALDAFDLDVRGAVALDVGASTGGFTDCLLQRGARHVFAVDVGYGQLAWRLRQDDRVTSLERCNARHLTAEVLRREAPPERWPPTLCTVDVSFISLTLVLPAVEQIVARGSAVVALIKPQFEAPRADVGKGGVVRDPEARARAIARVLDWARGRGYEVAGTIPSPIAGPKGNVEELALARTPPTAPEGSGPGREKPDH